MVSQFFADSVFLYASRSLFLCLFLLIAIFLSSLNRFPPRIAVSPPHSYVSQYAPFSLSPAVSLSPSLSRFTESYFLSFSPPQPRIFCWVALFSRLLPLPLFQRQLSLSKGVQRRLRWGQPLYVSKFTKLEYPLHHPNCP